METPRIGHAPIPMNRVADLTVMAKAGDYCFELDGGDGDVTHIHLNVPAGPDFLFNPDHKPERGRLKVLRVPCDDPRIWYWDGNEYQPTLDPSIHVLGVWHGWVQDGVMREH